MLSAVYQWFSGVLLELDPLLTTNLFINTLDESHHQGIRDLLRYADLGIWDYRMKDPALPDNKPQMVGERIEVLHQAPG